MPRVAWEIDRKLLERSVKQAESENTFVYRSKLFEEVASIYNSKKSKNLREITHSVVGLRCDEWGIPMKTPKSARGRKPGSLNRPKEERESIPTKVSKNGRTVTFNATREFEEGGMNDPLCDISSKAVVVGTRGPAPKSAPAHAITLPESRTNYISVRVPAGSPPVKINNFTKDDVWSWCEVCFHAGVKEGYVYTPWAMIYWLTYFLTRSDSKFKSAEKYIHEWFGTA